MRPRRPNLVIGFTENFSIKSLLLSVFIMLLLLAERVRACEVKRAVGVGNRRLFGLAVSSCSVRYKT